jgi:hypothetical protein
MASRKPKPGKQQANREYAQLLRMHDRLLGQMQKIRDELVAPLTIGLMRDIRNRTGNAPQESMGEVVTQIEEAIRALKLFESELQAGASAGGTDEFTVDGISNLPAPLARFLSERSQYPGFKYEVIQDEVRGWVIRWKEYTHRGTVRGCGQFYERPYAWLEE